MRRRTRRWMTVTVFLGIFSVHLTRWTNAGPITLYVSNELVSTVSQFSGSGNSLGNFASGLNLPVQLTVNSAGDLFVADDGGVHEYSPQGNLVLAISTPFRAVGVQVTATGTILVSDYFGGKIDAYSSTGQSLGLFCNPGLSRADVMAFDSKGNLYVSDWLSGVVEKISPTGVDEGHFLTGVYGVEGIAFDSHGNLYAAFNNGDFTYVNGTEEIREYSAAGTYLGVFTSSGLSNPTGITFGLDGNLYVANQGNNTIEQFSSTGTDLGVFASTGMNGPYGLVFSSSVPEPSSAILLLTAVSVLSLCLRIRRRQA
jgi:hypothetical protein